MDHDHTHHDHGDAACSSGHMMVFHTGVCQEILFSGWLTTTGLEVFYSCIAIFLAGFLYEALSLIIRAYSGEKNQFTPVPNRDDKGLKYVRESLMHRGVPSGRDSQVNIAKSECGPSSNGVVQTTTLIKQSMFSGTHFIQTGLHTVQTTCSYILMLIFMTYNVWLCLALVLGMTFGYFVFGWRKQSVVDVNEHCQ